MRKLQILLGLLAVAIGGYLALSPLVVADALARPHATTGEMGPRSNGAGVYGRRSDLRADAAKQQAGARCAFADIVKIIYILRYLQDAASRDRVQLQLNRGTCQRA